MKSQNGKNNNKYKNYKWYQYKNNNIINIPKLRGHTLTDIGNDSLITIGDHYKCTKIDIFKFNKTMNKKERLYATQGDIPCCRFDHCAEYIPMINCILFFGGFDSQCNYNDARLLSLTDMIWYDLEFQVDIDHRAYHASTSRLVTVADNHKWECYIFGGQYCAGGPYIYHNDVIKFTFYDKNYTESDAENDEDTIFDIDDDKDEDEKLGYFECEILPNNGNDEPRERSQSHSWIQDNYLYIYGGSYATSTLNDLWRLDLNTNIWEEIEYRGVLGAPLTKRLRPIDYHVVSKRKACYYDKRLRQLFVVHFGELSGVQRQFMKLGGMDSLCEFESRLNDPEMRAEMKSDMDGGDKNGDDGCYIFVYDIRERMWMIMNCNDDKKAPKKGIGTTRIIRIGEFMVLMGGGTRSSKINYMKQLHLLKIPNYRVFNQMSWSRERLIWIGHYNDNSVFNNCSKDIILLILSFLNVKPCVYS